MSWLGDSWLGDARDVNPRLRQALKATIAACLSFLIADFLELPQAFWAAVVAILVTQANIGASLGLAFDWFMGILVGAVIGGIIAILVGGSFELRLVGVAGAVLVLGYFAAAHPPMRIACVNAAIIILGTPVTTTPFASAGYRVLEVLIGTAVALTVMLLVFPARAGPALAAHIGRTLPLYFQLASDLLTMAMEGRYDAAAVGTAAARIRAVISTNASLGQQAQREVAGFLADSPNPEALLTALRRLWHTELILARAVSVPLPADIQEQMQPGLTKLREAVGALRVDVSEADEAVRTMPDIAAVEAAVGDLNAVVSSLRDSDALRTMHMDDAMRLMTLDFALEQLRQNLKDVTNRRHELAKLAGARIPWRRQLRKLLLQRV